MLINCEKIHVLRLFMNLNVHVDLYQKIAQK